MIHYICFHGQLLHSVKFTVAGLRGSKFFQFHAVFGENWAKSYVGTPLEGWRPTWGKSWIRHWFSIVLIMKRGCTTLLQFVNHIGCKFPNYIIDFERYLKVKKKLCLLQKMNTAANHHSSSVSEGSMIGLDEFLEFLAKEEFLVVLALWVTKVVRAKKA